MSRLMLVALIFTFTLFSAKSKAEIEPQYYEDEIISSLELNDEQALELRNEFSKMPDTYKKELTVCGSLGGGVIMAVDIYRCHDVQGKDYLITFKGFGISLYAKFGIVYIHSKRPILAGKYKAHEVSLHAGFGGYSIKLKNEFTHFTIRGLTYGVGMALSYGKAEVQILNPLL